MTNPEIEYYENGNVEYEHWYKDGKEITKADFKRLGIKTIKKMKAFSLFTPLELIKLFNRQ